MSRFDPKLEEEKRAKLRDIEVTEMTCCRPCGACIQNPHGLHFFDRSKS